MARLRLIHWKAASAAQYLDLLRTAGYTVEYSESFTPQSLRSWREHPPGAFIIDLTRLPSHGREIAIALRQSKATRNVPIVFCTGSENNIAEDKIEKSRAHLPDAFFCPLSKLRGTLRRALTARPAEAIVPVPMMDRYAARTTAQKLGIKEGATVLLVDPPRDCLSVLGDLPSEVQLSEDMRRRAAVTLCFAKDPDALLAHLSTLRAIAPETKLWICWRKGKTAPGCVGENFVRESALSLGLVDYKICSLNPVWSGLLFAAKR